MHAVRPHALASLLILTAACTSDGTQPTEPTSIRLSTPAAPNPTPAPVAGDFAPSFPAVSRPARVYVAVSWPFVAFPHGSPLASRYVLYDDGTFGLQYSSASNPFFEYAGTYKETNGSIELNFGPNWGSATAMLSGNSLTVRYNILMQMSDFEDGVYMASTP